ncbi:uncharacterized protein METZ01_LOCUS239997, partial [marine metagenome]
RSRYFWVDLDNSDFSEQEITSSLFFDILWLYSADPRNNSVLSKNPIKEKLWQDFYKGKVTFEIHSTIVIEKKSKDRPLFGSGPTCEECGNGTIPTASHTDYTKKITQTYSCVNKKCGNRWVERD